MGERGRRKIRALAQANAFARQRRDACSQIMVSVQAAHDAGATLEEIVSETGLTRATVRGVVNHVDGGIVPLALR